MMWRIVLIAMLASPVVAEIAPSLPPGAMETATVRETVASYLLPTARFTPDHQPGLRLEGTLTIRAYRLPPERADTLTVLRGVRAQLSALDYKVLHECAAEGCGGYDFRFHTRILPAPEMEIDLGDFRFIAAASRTAPAQHVGVLISRTARGGHVQIAQIAPMPPQTAPAAGPGSPAPASAIIGSATALESTLIREGRAVLDGIGFAPGRTDLLPGSTPALQELAAFLAANPGVGVVIVGHSDASGSRAANIRISRARAEAVRATFLAAYPEVAATRVAAEGVGYLAPIAPNATEEGRARNRRVEVVLTSGGTE